MSGVGTRLKERFAAMGIRGGGCSACGDLAKRMDAAGPAGCRDTLDEIMERLRANAKARGLPFSSAVVRSIVLAAIEEEERFLAQLEADRAKAFDVRVAEVLQDVARGPRQRGERWPFRPEVVAAHRQLFAEKLERLAEPGDHGEGRGIVTLGGSVRYFPAAYVLCSLLRSLGCTLPIELWYLSRHEFDHRMESILEPLGVRCVNAIDALTHPRPRMLGGWEAKAWAISCSRFAEVLYLDADQVPTRDPSYLFDAPEYCSSGVLAWPDFENALGLDCHRVAWEVLGLPVPGRSRHFEGHDKPTDYTPWESGQLLVNKRQAWRFLEAAKVLSDHADWWYPQPGGRNEWPVYGDKSTFMLAAQATGQAVAMPKGCGLFGDRQAGGFDQHDLGGEVVFQHRCMPQAKVRLSGANATTGLVRGELFAAAIEELRRQWKPGIWQWDDQSPLDHDVARRVPGQYFVTGLELESQRVEFGPGGTIGGARTTHWRIAHVTAGGVSRPQLIVADAQRAVAICERYPNGWIDRENGVAIQHTAPAWWEGVDSLFAAHVWCDVVLKNEYRLPKRLDGKIVLDIGAHEGMFAHAAFERGAACVISVEPHPENFARLTRNLERRPGSVRLHNAVWRSDEPARWVSLGPPAADSQHSGGYEVQASGLSPVRTIGLDELVEAALEAGGTASLGILKIDCEGAEWPILTTAKRLDRIDAICGELHAAWLWHYPDWWRVPRTKGEAVQALEESLRAAGYTWRIEWFSDGDTLGHLWAWRGDCPFLLGSRP